MEPGSEPVADDEFLYRRIPVSMSWYAPGSSLKPEAFAPHREHDSTGISVSRSKYKTVEEAAAGRPGKFYYIAVLRVDDLRQRGIDVVPRPLLGDPGHAELPDLNSADRKTDRVLELQEELVALCQRVEGPFPKNAAPTMPSPGQESSP